MKRILFVLLAILLCFSLCACGSAEPAAEKKPDPGVDYGRAEEYFAQGSFEEAKAVYSALGDYEDSQNKVLECDYQMAQRSFQEQDWEKALSGFTALGGYSDAQDRVKECKYQIGKQAYENADWEKAIAYFTEINFSDSEALLAAVLREKGMTENADYAFLADLEASVLSRMNEAGKDTQLGTLVDTELSYVEKYETLDFYDAALKELAQQYIDGLHLQKNSADPKYRTTRDLLHFKKLEGLVKRFDALSQLQAQYDFMKDNAEFADIYLSELDHWNNYYDGYVEILDDIDQQIQNYKDTKGYYMAMRGNASLISTWTNNTKYTYTATFEYLFYDEENNMYGTASDTIEKIEPGQTYDVSVLIPERNKFKSSIWDLRVDAFEFEEQYSEISNY